MGGLRQVFVHIGPFKTGTTYLQNVLWLNRAALAGIGVGVPCPDWPAQRRAVARLMAGGPGVPARPPSGQRARDPWDHLLREVDDSGAHTVLLSVERLCLPESHSVQALLESFAPARVDVVYAVRDLAKVLPAAWQTRRRNGEAPSWREYLASVRDPGGAESYGGRFWRRHDPAATLAPYLEHLPPERIHVVVVPPSGAPPALLWQRWCTVTGLDPDAYDLDVARANTSLGGVEAEVMRRLTARVADPLSQQAYGDLLNGFVARDVLERREQSFPLVLPAREHEWLDPLGYAAIDYLRGGGFPVAGDLAEALPVRVEGAREPDDVSDTEALAVMDDVLAATVLELARRSGLG